MKHLVLIILLMVPLLMGCTSGQKSHPAILDQADSISAINPRRALSVLDSVLPQMLLADSGTQMYYQLLRVKAQDRAYIRHTTMQSILPVISYYERHPHEDMLAWAYCYGGRVCRDLGDNSGALLYLQKSLDELADGRNPALRYRVLSQLGYLFYYQYLFGESRDIKREVITGDSLSGRYDKMVTCYTDIARCYIGEGQYDSAALVTRHAEALVRQHRLTHQQPAIDLLGAQVASYCGEYAQVLRLITPYLADTTLADATPYLSVATQAMMAQGLYADAAPICQRILKQPFATNTNKAAAMRHLALICQHRGQQDQALTWQQEAMALLDTTRQVEDEEKVTLVRTYYHNQQRERQMAQLRQEKSAAETRLYVVGSLLLSLLLAIGLMWMQHKRRQAERQLSRERAIMSFRSSELCQRIYALCHAQHPISPELWVEVEDYLNQSSPGFLAQLRRFTTLGETEWHITLLTRLGFRNVDIATLLCRHRSAISQAKKRLYAKVYGRDGKAEDWDKAVLSL